MTKNDHFEPKNVIFERFWPVSKFHSPACNTLVIARFFIFLISACIIFTVADWSSLYLEIKLVNHDLLHTVFRSIMLAREGYTVLELGYNVPQYGHKDYYSRKKPFDLKYIEMAIRKVLNHHSVYGDKVAIVGQSKGAELATAAACLMPHLIELSVRFVKLILKSFFDILVKYL